MKTRSTTCIIIANLKEFKVGEQKFCVEYKNYTLQEAADEVIQKRMVNLGGDGGLIAIDANGTIAMPFNTEGMYRGFKTSSGQEATAIYKD